MHKYTFDNYRRFQSFAEEVHTSLTLLDFDVNTINESGASVEQRYENLLSLVSKYCEDKLYATKRIAESAKHCADKYQQKCENPELPTDSDAEPEVANKMDSDASSSSSEDVTLSDGKVLHFNRYGDITTVDGKELPPLEKKEQCECCTEDENGARTFMLLINHEEGTRVEVPFKVDTFGAMTSIHVMYHDSVYILVPTARISYGYAYIFESDTVYGNTRRELNDFRWIKASNRVKQLERIPLYKKIIDEWDENDNVSDSSEEQTISVSKQ